MKILLRKIQPSTAKPTTKPAEASKYLMVLLNLMYMREWKHRTEAEMHGLIEWLNQELKIIAHVQKCRRCMLELVLDVERYGGRRGPWYLDLVNDPSEMEEIYEEKAHTRGTPRVRDYNIGSYWTGSSKDTVRFINDRMAWAKAVIEREVVAATKYLEILGSWEPRETLEKPEYPLQSSLFYYFLG